MVGFALDELERIAFAAPHAPGPLVAADLGTGTGVVALSLAVEGPQALEVRATDHSSEALKLFIENLNLVAHSRPDLAGRVHMSWGSWFDVLPGLLVGRLHVVVASPPYVSAGEWSCSTRWCATTSRSPHSYRARLASRTLTSSCGLRFSGSPPTVLSCSKSAPHQADEVASVARSVGFKDVEVRADFADRPRAVIARQPGAEDDAKSGATGTIDDAIAALKAGKVVAIPTDTRSMAWRWTRLYWHRLPRCLP